jgi:hypothetical protein
LRSFCGVAVIVCLRGIAFASQRPESAESAAWQAKTLSRTLGIPLDQATRIIEKDQASHVKGMPAAVALLGTIPLDVGLAYLVFYYTDPSRKAPAEGAREEVTLRG